MSRPAAGNAPFSDLDLLAFQREILDWYGLNGRELPWRGERDPYRILLSEVMLQQTGVQRVMPSYHRFLEAFPTLGSVAVASGADVLRAWTGLGYNRRALNLKRAAEVVGNEYGGLLPATVEALERLPGIGRYTARAVACFAFGVQVAVVDTNVRRVLATFAGRDLSVRETEALAERLLPVGQASDWNQALMDYGSLVYRAKQKRGSKATESFNASNRFWRGRIVDALRRHDRLSVPALLETLTYEGRDEQRVRGLVRTLHEEGMVAYDAGQDSVSLPA